MNEPFAVGLLFSAGDNDLENQPRGRPPSVIENDVLKHTAEEYVSVTVPTKQLENFQHNSMQVYLPFPDT